MKHCHKLVASVAKAAAGELYELMMSNNQLFDEWKRQNPGATPKQLEHRFTVKYWGRCLETARATLALMLRRDDVPESQKEEISEALILDNQLRQGRDRWLVNPTVH